MGLSPSSYRINSTRQLSARGRNLEVSYSFSQTLFYSLQCTNGPPPMLPFSPDPPHHPLPAPYLTPSLSSPSRLPVRLCDLCGLCSWVRCWKATTTAR